MNWEYVYHVMILGSIFLLGAMLKILNLQTPAATRRAMNRNNPAQTPARPKIGATTSRNTEEIKPTKTCSLEGDI